ncbi:MAG: adenylate/guanylate cyclase domain-containing protein [Hyphomicrobiales bacterium]|nr:adenylate/guanylate cyclase domain-containing protein [Hyphomicrobiales bacterium]
MSDERDQRRLTAVLAADVVGYSRLMGTDESGTLSMLRLRRREVLEPLLEKYSGRLVKLMGDGVLAEFASIVNAVQCAVDIQRDMEARNASLPQDRRMQLRIGVNLGDVIVDGDDIYGDGVNLAARLETLAETGGICISETVYQHVRQKLPLSYRDMGEQRVKNFAEPVRAYGISPRAAGHSLDATAATATGSSIVVLPFTNMSDEAEQQFFADGLTEDIITELSRFKHLFVISRNTAFKYKGQSVDVRQVARELRVQYAVEGSVRKSGNRVRITVQLIDAEADRHIWAERYDRQLDDIFALQDEMTTAIVATLPGRVEAATSERVARKPTDNMAAYECLLAGKLLHHRSTPADNEAALHFLDRAIALDPNYAHARAWRACTLGQAFVNGYARDPQVAFEESKFEMQKALQLDSNDSDVHRLFAAVNIANGDFDKVAFHQQRALSLNPNDDLIVVQQGEMLTWIGQPEEGIVWIEKAMRLNPYHPERFWNHLARAYFAARRYGEAITALGRLSAPDHLHHALLAACHAASGNEALAHQHAAEVLKREPGFRVEAYMRTLHYKRKEDREHHYDALCRAGLPR